MAGPHNLENFRRLLVHNMCPGDAPNEVRFERLQKAFFLADEEAAFLPGEREASLAHMASFRWDFALAPTVTARFSALTTPLDALIKTTLAQTPQTALESLLTRAPAAQRSILAALSNHELPPLFSEELKAQKQAALWLGKFQSEPHPDSASLYPPKTLLSETRSLVEAALDKAQTEAGLRLLDGAPADGSFWLLWFQSDSQTRWFQERVRQRHRAVVSAFDGAPLMRHLGQVRVTPEPRVFPRLKNPNTPCVDVLLPASFFHARGGFLAEASTAMFVGRALALASIDRTLPPALRHPVVGTTSIAIGTLTMIARMLQLGERHQDMSLTSLAALLILRLRIAASALKLAETQRSEAPERRSSFDPLAVQTAPAPITKEAELAMISEALVLPAPPASRLLFSLRHARAAYRGILAGVSLAYQLRNMFDEDWYRNPRSSPPLSDAMMRGGLVSCETLLSSLGGELNLQFLSEWLA